MTEEKDVEMEFDSPEIEGLEFRDFATDSDFSKMSTINQLSLKADGVVWVESEEDIRARFSAVKDRDPRSDVLFVDIFGTSVGYAQLSWDNEPDKIKAYIHSAYLLPEWRGGGIREALFVHNEKRIEAIASKHDFECKKFFQVWTYDEPNDWKRIVDTMGYTPAWHLLEMAHANLSQVRPSDLPRGITVRPPRNSEYHKLWELYKECFEGEPWFVPYTWSEDAYRNWVASSTFNPELVNVAWEGSDPVGIVEMVISDEEIKRTRSRVAHAWAVCVADRWRRQGVARALLTRGLIQARDLGIDEVLLDTEAENKHSAMKVYESVGFEVRRTFTFHRRSISPK
ncbi:MAG: GNAT family N-acetyltransferase [Methanobacteriota archaeon]|nr:MAG: GNAT family N-acetyltransferase [Euryarchaeota archaeon]